MSKEQSSAFAHFTDTDILNWLSTQRELKFYSVPDGITVIQGDQDTEGGDTTEGSCLRIFCCLKMTAQGWKSAQ